jgi:superfamily II DNA/RNA helicase
MTSVSVPLHSQAPTGSGKTLAYLLPIASALVAHGHSALSTPAGPVALVLAPTHELAQQIARAAAPLKRLQGLRTCCVHGGVDKAAQAAELARHPHILVATPGRCGTHRGVASWGPSHNTCDGMASACAGCE